MNLAKLLTLAAVVLCILAACAIHPAILLPLGIAFGFGSKLVP